ncbi:hypothetical protein MKEN_00160700 [Mycena kentingensis (nom. inval.)]|nr:hypothetical protein MKEN_00160700 [Mycena kentingensis (nom. inval.)]
MSREPKMYGRNRASVADLELELNNLFLEHPDAVTNENDEPVIPATALIDVFRSFAADNGAELLSEEEMGMFQALLETNPGLEVTPQLALGFIAQRTKSSPPATPGVSDEGMRGRQEERQTSPSQSRSSSNDSTGTSRNHSRPPSRGMPSPFDASRRQRSTPLGVGGNAPSSWTKRPPHHRRKSETGSDTEQTGPSSYNGTRPAGRARVPSTPTSPIEYDPDSPPPHGRFSRPASRNHGPRQLDDDLEYTLRQGLNSLPMPMSRTHDSDSDSDDDDEARIMDRSRSAASSTASMMPQDRVQALQAVNEDLGRKLMEAERTMQRKMAEHESMHEEMQLRLDEVMDDLSAAKREEKELKAKERTNHQQIQQLEGEVTKITRQLEASKASYTNLQKQYHDQIAIAERYRVDLREREDTVRTERETTELAQLEVRKLRGEQEQYEARIAAMEEEIARAQQAEVTLDEQKQENMLLKETIDRMRFDLDEMRSSSNGASPAGMGGASAQSSAPNTMSRSLGAELLGKMKEWGGMEAEEPPSPANVQNQDTEGEDVVQTIITRKKRKVPSKATASASLGRREFEERKEYADVATQYDLDAFFVSSKAQTDPEPTVLSSSLGTQADPEPEPATRVSVEMEVQTDATSNASPATTPDDPPAYKRELTAEEQAEHDWRVTVATLKKYHPGARVEEGVPGGVSLDALEDWRALKEELGVSCGVIDKIIENSPKTGAPRARSSSPSSASSSTRRRRRSFYNIYNTYVYGHPHSNATPLPAIPPPVWWVGGTLLAVLALGPALFIPQYTPPGGPTHYDRAVFSSFNTLQYSGEGFAGAGDGAEAVWSVLARVGGGAVRMVRGWPQ